MSEEQQTKYSMDCPFTDIHEDRLDHIETSIEDIRKRVYNGLGKELRSEVGSEVKKTGNLVVGILVSLLLALSGVIIEGRVSASQAQLSNDKNYEALMLLDKRLAVHLQAYQSFVDGLAARGK